MEEQDKVIIPSYYGMISVEDENGNVVNGVQLMRHEVIEDEDDMESVIKHEFVGIKKDREGGDFTEYYLGDDQGDNMIIKVKEETNWSKL